MVILEAFNLVCSTTYSLILVGILKRIEHKYPEFFKIFGPPLAITTFFDKLTSGYKRALKTSRQIKKEPKDISQLRMSLRLKILKTKKHVFDLNEEALFKKYIKIFPGYKNIFPFPAQSQNLLPDEFILSQVGSLVRKSQSSNLEDLKAPKIMGILSPVSAVYGLWSVMFQSLGTLLDYNVGFYPLAIIAGSWIAYTEYDDIKELITHFKEKTTHWGEDVKQNLKVGLYILNFSLLMFISFVFSYSEFDEARNAEEAEHGFAPVNTNVIFNWCYTIPLLIFEMLSLTQFQSEAYGAFSFFIKSFSKRAVTKISSYRERFLYLLDSLIEVIDQASADGLQAIEEIVDRPKELLSHTEAY